MQSHRILSGLTIFVMVVLVAVGYLLVAQPQLAVASTANEQLAKVNTQISATQATITTLKNDQKKLPALKTQLAALRLSIPQGAQVSQYIDDLNALASASGVTLQSISVSPATIYVPPVVSAPATTTPAAGGSTPAPSASATAPAAPAAPVAPAKYTPTTQAAINSSNFVIIPLTLNVAGSAASTLSFLAGVQSGNRLFLVSGLATSSPSESDGKATMVINGYIYVLLDPDGAAAGKTTIKTPTATLTPTPTATPTVSSTPSPSGTATPTPTQSPTPTKKP